tara:strand:- start:842 stop:2353 length:1512 start_codon:yes stop_codon:yes gene_type:complete
MKKSDTKISEPSEQQLSSLLKYYQTGLYKEAEKLSLSITKVFPNHQFAWKVLAIILKQTGRINESLIASQKSVELNIHDAEAHNNLANTLLALGKIKDSEISYRKAISLKPDYAKAHSNLGVILQEIGRLKEAEACHKKAIILKTDYAEAHYNLGVTLKELGKLEETEECYRQAITLKPDYVEAHNNLGVLLEELERLDEAEASYRKTIMINPNFAEAHSNLGVILNKRGLLEKAELSYRKAIILKPDFANVHYNLGGLLIKLNKLEEAKVCLEKAMELKPNYSEAKHIFAALTGETTNSAPREYIENLFNNYAINFDHSLVDKLEYKAPKKITEIILAKHQNIKLGSVLDLGCGTGLLGDEIRKYCSKLEGIDLSKAMLEKAKTKNKYEKLKNIDIVEYLSTEDLNFNCFISTDVFVYIGELSEIFHLIKSRNKIKGKFIFSTEHTNKEGFILKKSGKYSHSKEYIESLCEKFDYKLSHFEKINLRKDKDKFIIGGLYFLDF